MPLDDAFDQHAKHYSGWNSLFSPEPAPEAVTNLETWRRFLNMEEGTQEDILKLYLETTPEDFEKIMVTAEGGQTPVGWENNRMLKAIQSFKKKEELVKYLRFSKKLETEIGFTFDYWESDIVRDKIKLAEWNKELELLLKQTKTKELKNRYTYHKQRLAFYSGNYEEAVQLYDKELAKWDHPLRSNALNNKFGALWHMKEAAGDKPFPKTAEMIQCLYEVFNRCQNCQIVKYAELSSLTAGDFFEAVKQTEDPKKQVEIWLMASYQSVPLEYAFERIAAINPNAPELKIIMSRQVLLWERNALTRDQVSDRSSEPLNPGLVRELYKLGKNTLVENQSFWLSQVAFYYFLKKDTEKALTTLFEAESVPGSDDALSQKATKTLTHLVGIQSWTKGDLKANLVARKMEKLIKEGNPDLYQYALQRIGHLAMPHDYLYEYQVLAEAALNHALSGSFNLSELERLEKSLAKPASPLLKILWEQSGITQQEIQAAKGYWYMNKRMFAKAYSCFQQANHQEQLPADPYTIHLVDCHDCDQAAYSANGKLVDFMGEMKALRQEFQTKPSAQTALKLANAHYNLTQFGNLHYYTYNSTFDKNDLMHPEYIDMDRGPVFKSIDITFSHDMTWAAYYYKKAFELSKDKEFKAKMSFMLAKCEQNQYYVDKVNPLYSDWNDDCVAEKNSKYRVNFKHLIKNFSDTKFYQEALKECSYFEHFVKAHG